MWASVRPAARQVSPSASNRSPHRARPWRSRLWPSGWPQIEAGSPPHYCGAANELLRQRGIVASLGAGLSRSPAAPTFDGLTPMDAALFPLGGARQSAYMLRCDACDTAPAAAGRTGRNRTTETHELGPT